MEKLTQQKYVNLLPGTSFIRAIHNHSIGQLINELQKLSIDQIKSHAIYEIESVNLRSKDMVFTRKEREDKAYRDFIGKNEYYQDERGILYHVNTRKDGHTCIFVNI